MSNLRVTLLGGGAFETGAGETVTDLLLADPALDADRRRGDELEDGIGQALEHVLVEVDAEAGGGRHRHVAVGLDGKPLHGERLRDRAR